MSSQLLFISHGDSFVFLDKKRICALLTEGLLRGNAWDVVQAVLAPIMLCYFLPQSINTDCPLEGTLNQQASGHISEKRF